MIESDMSSAPTTPVFTVLEEWGLVVCEPCRYVVWPMHIAAHCHKQHGVDRAEAAAIAAGYDNAENLRHGPDELHLPLYVERPIPILPIHRGLVCQVDPETCRYVSLTESSQRLHQKSAHRQARQLSTATRLRQRQQAIVADMPRWRDTFCQRFFTRGAKSSYFEVRHVSRGTAGRPPTPDQATKEARTDDGRDTFGQLMAHATTQYETTIRDIRAVVGERGTDEPNPLLQWAEWDKYLQGCGWADLLALTERPDAIEEPVASAIWTAMEEVAYITNETVRQAAFATRLQATRIREGEHRIFALQAIPDRLNVVKYVRPWQGIMMFFVRTQQWGHWQRWQTEKLRRMNLTSW
jgi:Orsellinic acid/F9775 biosynthesis cluster protein D